MLNLETDHNPQLPRGNKNVLNYISIIRLWRMLLVGCMLFMANVGSVHSQSYDLWQGVTKNMVENIQRSFSGTNLIFQISAPVSAYFLVNEETDFRFAVYVDKTDITWPFVPGLVLGATAPFILGGGFIWQGVKSGDPDKLNAGYAVVQSSLLTVSYVSILKAITGRHPPERDKEEDVSAISKDFKFGFFNRGIFDGWPSGHVAITTSIAATLAYYYDQNWIKWAGTASVAYMFASVTMFKRGRVHWLSDAVAGILVGYPIGKAVGLSYKTLPSFQARRPLTSWNFSFFDESVFLNMQMNF